VVGGGIELAMQAIGNLASGKPWNCDLNMEAVGWAMLEGGLSGMLDAGEDVSSTRFISFPDGTIGRTPPIFEAGIPQWKPKIKNGVVKSSAEAEMIVHYNKHQTEFPEFSSTGQYVRGANDFVRNPPSTAVSRYGDTVIATYDEPSNTFAIYDYSATIHTYFRPDPAAHGFSTNFDFFMNASLY